MRSPRTSTTEDCTLSGGTETTCYRITVAGYPASHDVGPFCPDTITDTADAGGIWFDGDGVYDLDGEFFVDLPTLYGDDNWQMYDEDGNILVTETAEEFEAAARPDVDPDLREPLRRGRARMARERRADHHHGADPDRARRSPTARLRHRATTASRSTVS